MILKNYIPQKKTGIKNKNYKVTKFKNIKIKISENTYVRIKQSILSFNNFISKQLEKKFVLDFKTVVNIKFNKVIVISLNHDLYIKICALSIKNNLSKSKFLSFIIENCIINV